ncbi:cytochrome c peroxidase [Neolewinella lacunae]|uniref:Cytochrome-c peroxidase n=1 Tax=Neolewinella lacunae TaxID=1517758 RepID=A0A923PRK7_9BACT|nr:cytochrome c peroxidase [Neolewinella lacunae]MBC6996199.1 cytochrome-c peroxidase [Neolewinella lacunae]MDN3637156.1 cytochrome c peroxidase [Neolewinella lacunae]
MHRLLTLFAIVSLFLLTACLPESSTIDAPRVDGFSDPDDLRFNDEEFATLSAQLNIPREIPQPITRLPQHIGNSTGMSELLTSSSDARKALLGRVLFYDKQLSATGETSCATCHLQEKAFSDDKAFSDGINGAVTKRNSIALGSVPTFAPAVSGYGSSDDGENRAVEGRVKFFWDERAATIKEQSIATIQDPIEMGKDLHQLSSELRNQEIYRILSVKAFGTADLTPDRITLALEKFTASIMSMNSRFDELVDAEQRGQQLNGRFTDSELAGRRLFLVNCASCHSPSLTEPLVPVANNGLEVTYADQGVGGRTGSPFDNGVFKVPFLRNVALTGPYMHDGRFATLREVIDHYSDGIQDHRNLHPLLRDANNRPRKMRFSEAEKQALLDFLAMTTDESVLRDPALADPFR